VAATRAFVRSLSARLRDDRPLAPDIERAAAAIRDGTLVAAVQADVGALA
jgi:histidine ammonia-lyase